MSESAPQSTPWVGWLTLLLAVFVYFYGLNSQHAATNGDELLYAQITRVTAATGHWLPLQSQVERHRNTKPPALFWQGILSTNWAKHYNLWRLRFPNVLYTLGLAAMAFLVGRKLGGGNADGLLSALIYLCFFGTYRYGRVFLTSAPESFWLFLPFCILLLRPRPIAPLGWRWAATFGLMFGVALLYKSFALVVPACAGLAWWALIARERRFAPWIKTDAPQIALAGLIALAIFGLWYALDPQRHLILSDFILDENVGKFDAEGENYFLNLVWGGSSIWRNVAAYPLNAGLLAPVVLAVFIMAIPRQRVMPTKEKLLWAWIMVLFLVFTLPNQRDERYLLPGMPALAVLCALAWRRIPPWVLGISLAAVTVVSFGLLAGAVLLTRNLAVGPLYPWYFWLTATALIVLSFASLFRQTRIRNAVLPGIILLYFLYALFLIPFDGPRGFYDTATQQFASGRTISVPINFGAREELYQFLLPGADPKPYKIRRFPGVEALQKQGQPFVLSTPLGTDPLAGRTRLRVVGTRLELIDRFNNEETMDMLRGNVSPHLFHNDILVEVTP